LDRFDKETFKEPFLLTISTYNFHMPYSLPKDFTELPDFDSDLLKAMYAVDNAFGRFWTWFKTSKYYMNTIIVATSDHTMYPGSKYKHVVDGKSFVYFDAVPFIVYDPTHDLPKRLDVLSTSVDITPSLLHLLDINVPNAFEGLSVFDPDGRPSHQNILGTQYNHHFFMLNNTEHEFSNHNEGCSSKEMKVEKENNPVFNMCDFLTWFQYKKWLSANNRIIPQQ
jgi:phosphoglycerol transferase MdoB-like AlkP superfamily enzyme